MRKLILILLAAISCGPNYNGLIMDESNDLRTAIVSARDLTLVEGRIDQLKEKHDVRLIRLVEMRDGVFTYAVYYYLKDGQK